MTNITEWEQQNVETLNNEVRVRRGWRTVLDLTTTEIVGGFSLECPNTTEIFHYIFTRDTSSNGTVSIYSEKFTLLTSLAVGKIQSKIPITYAVQNRQILINSPGLKFPLYGIQGGGLKRADKSASVNIDTTTLDIPSGLCCSFGDRWVVASGQNLFFNDPGIHPLAFVAENRRPVPATIYHIEQTEDGFLLILTNDGTYLMPKDALGKSASVDGSLSKQSQYQAYDYLCGGSNQGLTIGLAQQGITAINMGGRPLKIPTAKTKRYWLEDLAPRDMRQGKVFKSTNGFYIGYDEVMLQLDVRNDANSWHYNEGVDYDLVGVLNTRDGENLLLMTSLTSNQVLFPKGSRDDVCQDGYLMGFAGGELKCDSSKSNPVREIITTSDNLNQLQFAYIRGLPTGISTGTSGTGGVIIGTDTWGSKQLADREPRSVRHRVNLRTDSLNVEVGTAGSGRLLQTPTAVVRGQGKNREDK